MILLKVLEGGRERAGEFDDEEGEWSGGKEGERVRFMSWRMALRRVWRVLMAVALAGEAFADILLMGAKEYVINLFDLAVLFRVKEWCLRFRLREQELSICSQSRVERVTGSMNGAMMRLFTDRIYQ